MNLYFEIFLKNVNAAFLCIELMKLYDGHCSSCMQIDIKLKTEDVEGLVKKVLKHERTTILLCGYHILKNVKCSFFLEEYFQESIFEAIEMSFES